MGRKQKHIFTPERQIKPGFKTTSIAWITLRTYDKLIDLDNSFLFFSFGEIVI
jgi:hypothetical protein